MAITTTPVGPSNDDARARTLTDREIRQLWNLPTAADHKYTRGVLGMVTGSSKYPGAGVLSVGGALAGGPGMIRYLGSSPLVVPAFVEVVAAPGRVDAWVVGSGIDPENAGEVVQIERLLSEAGARQADLDSGRAAPSEGPVGQPAVIDAGALSLIRGRRLAEWLVLTPHHGELAGVLRGYGQEWSAQQVHERPEEATLLAAKLSGATVMLTAATDLVASPDGELFAQSGSPAWRATAGAGDVLAGLTGAMLLAFGEREDSHVPGRPTRAAAAAARIHGLAAALAAGTASSENLADGVQSATDSPGSGTTNARVRGAKPVPRPDAKPAARSEAKPAPRVGHPITASQIAARASEAVDRILNHE